MTTRQAADRLRTVAVLACIAGSIGLMSCGGGSDSPSSGPTPTPTPSPTPSPSPAAPVITTQPADQTAAYPQDNDFDSRSANFTVAASGVPAPTFQWQLSTDGGLTFTDIAGATGATYAPPNLTLTDSGTRYRVVARNSVSTATSRTAALTVADLGFGGATFGHAVRPSGEVVASVVQVPSLGPFAGLRTATATPSVRTLAGGDAASPADGTGAAARFAIPGALALDTDGNTYVFDSRQILRRATPAGVVTSIAGSSARGLVDGSGASARFDTATALALGGDGNLYVADSGNSAIRRVTPAGQVSTFAGGTAGAADGNGTAAQFTTPYGIAADAAGNLYVAEPAPACRIRKVTPSAVVTTYAGTGGCGVTVNGALATARFTDPAHLAFDGLGNLFVSDSALIRKITPDGTVSTAYNLGADGSCCYTRPPLAADAAGNVYSARSNGATTHMLKITPAGVASRIP